MILESPYNTPRKWNGWYNHRLLILALGLFTAALVYRRADAFTNPQFWAEDGMVFFVEQDHHAEFIPFQNYNGYIHFIPRTVAYAEKTLGVPLEWAPVFYNYATYGMCLFYLGLLWFFLPYTRLTRFFMITCLGVLPLATEVYMNLTNVQWFSCLGLMLLFFNLKIKPGLGWVWLLIAVLMAGLTGPFSVMFLPLLVWKCWKHRKNMPALVPCLLAVFTGLIQLGFLYTHFHGRIFPALPIPKYHVFLTFYNTIKQALLLDHRMITEFRWRHLVLILPPVLGYVYMLWRSIKKRKEINLLILLCLGLNVFFTIQVNWPYEWLMSPFLGGMRYFFIPFTLVCWFMLIQLQQIKPGQYIMFGALLALFFAHGKWVRSKFLDLKWKQEVEEYRTKGDLIIPINPLGWFVILRKE
jgi:hypothetical protein